MRQQRLPRQAGDRHRKARRKDLRVHVQLPTAIAVEDSAAIQIVLPREVQGNLEGGGRQGTVTIDLTDATGHTITRMLAAKIERKLQPTRS